MSIASEDLDEALLRQSVGSQQSRRLTEEERRIVAYHEAGHALCRRLCGLDPPEILSIVPRARDRSRSTGALMPQHAQSEDPDASD
jgi:cell division protease FtsH